MDKKKEMKDRMKEQWLKNRLTFAKCRRACAFEHRDESKFELETYYRYDAEVDLLKEILKQFKMYDDVL